MPPPLMGLSPVEWGWRGLVSGLDGEGACEFKPRAPRDPGSGWRMPAPGGALLYLGVIQGVIWPINVSMALLAPFPRPEGQRVLISVYGCSQVLPLAMCDLLFKNAMLGNG